MLCASCERTVEAVAGDLCPECGASVLLEGRYRLERMLGRGTSGTTYLATRVADGAEVAIKELPYRELGSFKAQELSDREAKVLRQLDHSRIPRYVDDFTAGEGKSRAMYIVQEFIRGRTLADEMQTKRYNELEVIDILGEIFEVLEYLQALKPPVVHRDIKPKNLIRGEDGKLRLIDFGSVADLMKTGGGSTVAGTYGYMAPEQFKGMVTESTDLYAAGVLAVVLLSRRAPERMIGDDHKLDFEPSVNAHEALVKLLKLLVDPSPATRLPSAREGRVRLERIRALVAESQSSPKLPMHRPQRPMKREPISRWWFAIAGVIAISGAAFATMKVPPRPVLSSRKVHNYTQVYRVKPSVVLAEGDFDQRMIERLLSSAINKSFDCFERAQQVDGLDNLPAQQTATVRLFIEPDGKVAATASSALNNSKPRVYLSHNAQVSTCLSETFSKVHFPSHDGDEKVQAEVRYEIELISR